MDKFFTTAQKSVATSTIENNFIVNRFFETIEQILITFLWKMAFIFWSGFFYW